MTALQKALDYSDKRIVGLKAKIDGEGTVKTVLTALEKMIPKTSMEKVQEVTAYDLLRSNTVRVIMKLDSLNCVEPFLDAIKPLPLVICKELGDQRLWTEDKYHWERIKRHPSHITPLEDISRWFGWYVLLEPSMVSSRMDREIGSLVCNIPVNITDDPAIMPVNLELRLEFPEWLATIAIEQRDYSQSHIDNCINASTGLTWASGDRKLLGNRDLVYTDLKTLKQYIGAHWREHFNS